MPLSSRLVDYDWETLIYDSYWVGNQGGIATLEELASLPWKVYDRAVAMAREIAAASKPKEGGEGG